MKNETKLVCRKLFCILAPLMTITTLRAQQTILGKNLIVNGNAESGMAAPDTKTLVSTIPGWTRTGSISVLPYDLTGYLQLKSPAPPDHGFQYFIGSNPSTTSTLTQDIDVSSVATMISAGNIKFTASAYLGNGGSAHSGSAQMDVAFKNSAGQTFSTATLGPESYIGTGLVLQQQIGLLPTGTLKITVTLSLFGKDGGTGALDSASLILSSITIPSSSALGTNLVVNGGAEAGPSAQFASTAPYIPGWSTASGASVAPYGGAKWISSTDPGPVDRGVNLFCGFDGEAESTIYQDIDVSSAATGIDAGQVVFEIGAWLGSLGGQGSPTLTYSFYDWSGTQLAATAQLGPLQHSTTALLESSRSGQMPPRTRRVRIFLTIPYSSSAFADNISFILAAPSGPPVITAGGVVSASAFGAFPSVSPGSWIEIYGINLAPSTRSWAGSDFVNGVGPTSLNGVRVSVAGKSAFVGYVSSGQVNVLIPSDVPAGAQPLTMDNTNGTSDKFWLNVYPTQPGFLSPSSFVVGGKQYLAAILQDGSFALPSNSVPGVASRPATPGEVITVYGIGFGPVNDGTPAGTLSTQPDSLSLPLQVFFNTTTATLAYGGLAPTYTGLYQFNIVVPKTITNGAVPLSFTLGGTKGAQTLYIAVQN